MKPDVWTSEPLSGEGPEWYWGRDKVMGDAPYPREALTAESFRVEHCDGFQRSVHPMPSAEALAAMLEVCELVKEWRALRAAQVAAGKRAEALTSEYVDLIRLQNFDGAAQARDAVEAAARESGWIATQYQAMQAGDVFDAALKRLEVARG